MKIGRRNFFIKIIEGIVLLVLGRWLVSALPETSASIRKMGGGKSKVVDVHHRGASFDGVGRDNEHVNGDIVREMVHAGILALTGENDLQKAWGKIFPDPGKKIAIKVNCQIRSIFTKVSVVQPIIEGLFLIGVPSDNILIYDMTDNAFDLAGFVKNLGPGVKIGTVVDFGGYSRFLFQRLANLLTGGYENSVWNYLAKVATDCRSETARFLAGWVLSGRNKPWDCAYLINVPVLKSLEGYSGVSLSMKNHYGSIANPGEHHKDIMDYIPFVNNLPQIRNKTRLIVMDAIFGGYKWINGREQRYIDKVNRILLSDDPVAIDFIGWKMIEELRKKHGVSPLNPQPVFIDRAASLGIGVMDPEYIDLQAINLSD